MLKILISQRTTETGLTSDCLDGLKDSVMPSFNINGVNKGHEPIIYIFFFSVALRPNAGQGLLMLEVSIPRTITHHSR